MTDEKVTLTTGQRIRIARTERGWTQRQLADATGIGQSRISRYEKGVESPNADTVDRIMNAIGSTHTLDAVDGVLGIQGRAAGKLVLVDALAEPKPVSWVVEEFAARGAVTMIAGEAGAGKSYFTQTVGVGLARGDETAAGFKLDTKWCVDGQCPEEHEEPHRRNVLVVDAENGANLVQERVQDIGLTDADVKHYTTANSEGFDIYKDRDTLDAVLRDYKDAGEAIDLLILDSWLSLWAGNENVVEQVQNCLNALRLLATRHNLAVVLIHHTDKEGENYRGSSMIAATIECVFTFTRADDGDLPEARFLTCKKMRIAKEPTRKRLYVTGHGIDDNFGGLRRMD